jgi:hypothetical protein
LNCLTWLIVVPALTVDESGGISEYLPNVSYKGRRIYRRVRWKRGNQELSRSGRMHLSFGVKVPANSIPSMMKEGMTLVAGAQGVRGGR